MDQHVLQIDPGDFVASQGGVQVLSLVVEPGQQGATVEHWFLYAAGQGQPPQGYGVYTRPSSSNSPVTTTYTYNGQPPPNFNPSVYKQALQQQLGQGLVVQYVRADCSPPQAQRRKKKQHGQKARPKATSVAARRAKPAPKKRRR